MKSDKEDEDKDRDREGIDVEDLNVPWIRYWEDEEEDAGEKVGMAIRANDARSLREAVRRLHKDMFLVSSPLHVLVQQPFDTTELCHVLEEARDVWEVDREVYADGGDDEGESDGDGNGDGDGDGKDDGDSMTISLSAKRHTALSYLCEHFHEPHGWTVVDWLLRHGANPRRPLQCSALSCAVHRRNCQLVTRLLAYCPQNETAQLSGSESWLTDPFYIAIKEQNDKALRLLYNHFRYIPFRCVAKAVSHGHMLLTVLDHVPNLLNKALLTDVATRPLDLALRDGTLSLVKALVGRGARCYIRESALTGLQKDALFQSARSCWSHALGKYLSQELVAVILRLLNWTAVKNLVCN